MELWILIGVGLLITVIVLFGDQLLAAVRRLQRKTRSPGN